MISLPAGFRPWTHNCSNNPSPMNRELLASAVAGGQTKPHPLCPVFPGVECTLLVIEVCIVVVHFVGVGPIVIDYISRYSFSEVRFKAIYTHLITPPVFPVPAASGGIGKVDDRHSRLPHIPLPDVPICPFKEIAMFHTLIEKLRFLGNVGLIQTQVLMPRSLICRSVSRGFAKTRSSQVKSVQWKSFIQKQSKWNTARGISRSSMPWIKLKTVLSS